MRRNVVCASGLKGWQGRLREPYLDFEEFVLNDEAYGLAARLGYPSATAAWEANPVVQGSVEPSDYRKVSD